MIAEQLETFKKRALTGVVFLAARRILIQVVFTIANIFLARLLYPADFGTFGIVSFVTTFFTVFSDLGLGPSLIQKKDEIANSDLQTAFTFQLLLSILLILVVFFLSPLISSFYNLGERGVELLRIYSLIFLVGPFKTTSGAILERGLVYKKLVIVETLQVLTSEICMVLFAIMSFGVFSLVWGSVIGSAIGAALYFIASPWPVRLYLAKKNLFSLAKFGLPLQTHVVSGLFFGPLILLYLGKVVGSENLGFYQFAFGLSVFPSAISEIVNRIVFPLGARMQKDKVFFRQIIEQSIAIVSLTSLPLIAILMASAPLIVHFLYTDRWLPALPALYLGLLQMGIISFTGVFVQFLLSRGLATVMRNIGIFWAILTWIISPPLIHQFNFVGMSIAGLIVSATGIWLVFRLRKEVYFSIGSGFTPYFLISVLTGLVVFLTVKFLPASFWVLFFGLVVGFATYTGLIMIFAKKTVLNNLRLLTIAIRKG